MKCELKGGPADGKVIDVDPELIRGDGEYYIPIPKRSDQWTTAPTIADLSGKPYYVATYRWLFGAPDHLDWAGYQN